MFSAILKPCVYSILLVCSMMSFSATAQEPLKLEGSAHLIRVVVDEQGNPFTSLVEPEVVVPGDRVLFATTYENKGDEVVTNFVVTNPIPTSVQLANDADRDLTVSVDGGVTWGRLSDLVVPDGEGATRTARYRDVTHLRWIIPLIAPSDTGSVEYIGVVR